MFSTINRILGNVKVVEKNGIIRITGIPANVMARDIQTVWKTSRIYKHMFLKESYSSIEFYSFFAVEVLFILERLLETPRAWTSVRVINTIIGELRSNTWLSSIDTDDRYLLDHSKFNQFYKSPLPHQLEFFTAFNRGMVQYKLKGFMLASPAGTGKTLTGLFIGAGLDVDQVIVVCPNNAVNDPWVKTVQNDYKKSPTYWSSKMDRLPTKDDKVIVAHYEALAKVKDYMSTVRNMRILVLLDESHNLNEINSLRTKTFVSICEHPSIVATIWSSGTPLKAMGKEAMPFIKSIDPMFNEKVEVQFKKIFGLATDRALDILAHRLGILMHRIDKKKIVAGEPIEEEIKISFNGAERFTLDVISKEMAEFIRERQTYYADRKKDDNLRFKEYIDIARRHAPDNKTYRSFDEYIDTVELLHRSTDYRHLSDQMAYCNRFEKNVIEPLLPKDMIKDFREVKSIYKYVLLKIRGEALGRILGKRRAECHAEMVKHIDFSDIINNSEKKTLIFTSFVEAAVALEPILKKQGYTSELVYGQTNKNLTSIIKSFESNSKVNPLVATYQSLSTAVPLIMANSIILINQPFRDYERIQAISRVHRLGQTEQVRVFNCLLDTGDVPNISTRSKDILEWSKRQVNSMMGISEEVSDTSLEGLSDLDHICIDDDVESHEKINNYLTW